MDVSSDSRDFFGNINNERMLIISYVPHLNIGFNNERGYATMTISLDGVSYSLNVSGVYYSEDTGYQGESQK